MKLKSFAKVNLSLDVLGVRPDGYHNISSFMQNIDLYDEVEIEKCSKNRTKYKMFYCSISNVGVYLCSCVDTIPLDENNLAIRGAKIILNKLEDLGVAHGLKELTITIDKKLPVAAGIAGGSGNAATTMLGINALAGYPMSLRELMDMGKAVGADVPFSIMMNANLNSDTLSGLKGIKESSVAANVSGIGEIVEPAKANHRYVILANPGISVSTKEAYQAIDALQDNSESGLFTNQLEKYTLANYPEAKSIKEAMQEHLRADIVLMSGSGPTMVAYYQDKAVAQDDYERILCEGWLKESWRAWLTQTGNAREE